MREERRQDSLSGTDMLLAPTRSGRPDGLRSGSEEECPFCPGAEHLTTDAVLVLPKRGGESREAGGWQVRVVANKYPAVAIGPRLENPSEAEPGLTLPWQRWGDGTGGHEVVVECPAHDADLATRSCEDNRAYLDAVAARVQAWVRRPGVAYVSVFRNAGLKAGATQPHPHTQIVALDFVPLAVQGREAAHAHWRERLGACPHCVALESELRDGSRLICDYGAWIALSPWSSRVNFEVALWPREDTGADDDWRVAELALALGDVAGRLWSTLGAVDYNVEWLLPSVGSGPGRPPLTLRVVPRTAGTGGFEWATGAHIASISPESAAARLRNCARRGGL